MTIGSFFHFGDGRRFVNAVVQSRYSKLLMYLALAWAVVFWVAFFWFSFYFPGSYPE